jgi:hypothetical protein
MKKISSKFLLVFAMAICLVVGFGINAKVASAKVSGLVQKNATQTSARVNCQPELGFKGYYVLLISNDNVNYVPTDWDSDCTYLNADNLFPGSSYYVKVAMTDTWDDTNYLAGSMSDPIEIVTCPDCSKLEVYQSDATTSSVSLTGTGMIGANYFELKDDSLFLGASYTNTVTNSTALRSGYSFWPDFIPCRISSTGFVAEGYGKSTSAKTVMKPLSTNSIGIANSWLYINSYGFSFSTSDSYDGYQWQFLSPSGKVLKTYTDKYNIENFINGKAMKYRFRTYVTCGTQRRYSAWSGCKYLGFTRNITSKIYKRKYVKISWSKVNNVSSYSIYTSTKEKSGYKKFKTVSAKTRSVIIKKIAGKSIKKNKNYYVRIIPNVKVGKKTYSAGNFSYYTFKIW